MLTACEYQKVDAVHYLVGRSDVDVSDFVVESSDEGGRTGEKSALHIAAIHDSEEIAKALLDKGCKANRKDIMVCKLLQHVHVQFICSSCIKELWYYQGLIKEERACNSTI